MKTADFVIKLLIFQLSAFYAQAEERQPQSLGTQLGESALELRNDVEKLYTPAVYLVRDVREDSYRLMYKTRTGFDQFVYDFRKVFYGDSDN